MNAQKAQRKQSGVYNMSTSFGYIGGLDIKSEGLSKAFGMASDNQNSEPSENQTLLSKIGATVSTPSVAASSLNRNAMNAATDVQDVKQVASTALGDAKASREDIKTQFDGARAEAVTLLKSVAQDNPGMGITAASIDQTFTSPDTGPVSAAVAMVGGGGSLATHTVAFASAAGDLKSAAKGMSSSQVKGLVAEAAIQANSSGGPVQKMSGFGAAPVESEQDKPSVLAGVNKQDLLDLAHGKFEDQPEIIALDAQIAELESVLDNLSYVEAHQHDGQGNKLQVAIDQGDSAAIAVMIEKDPISAIALDVIELPPAQLLAAQGTGITLSLDADTAADVANSGYDQEAAAMKAAQLASSGIGALMTGAAA